MSNSWKLAYTIFHPITSAELRNIPDAQNWPDRTKYVSEQSYQDTKRKIAEAFAEESEDYIVGYVSGFNAAIDQLSEIRDQLDSEGVSVWNHLMLLLSEVARHMPEDYTGPLVNPALPN